MKLSRYITHAGNISHSTVFIRKSASIDLQIPRFSVIFFLPSGLAPINTSAKFLLGMFGKELM